MTDAPRPPMPPEIAKAIVEVMKGVHALKKTQKNKHSDYLFAGIDDFLEMVRPLMAAAGLIIMPEEVSFEQIQGEKSIWLRSTYEFTLIANGVTWEHRPRKTVACPAAMGAQAYGTVQSYNLKMFLRGLLMVATGDFGEDEDVITPGDLPMQAKPKAAPPRRAGASVIFVGGPLFEDMKRQPTIELLNMWHAANEDKIRAQPIDWQEKFYEFYDQRRGMLAPQ